MKFVQFILLREGTSDDALLGHLEEMLLEAGVDEALGEIRPMQGSSEAKLEQIAATDSHVSLVFVHRDADGAGADARRAEIETAAACLPTSVTCIPIVPVRMTEAWLLLDAGAIRRVAGNETGSMRLDTPSASTVEAIADAKGRLKSTLAAASGLTGKRLSDFQKRFPDHRRQLLSGLDRSQDIRLVPSFESLVQDVSVYVEAFRG